MAAADSHDACPACLSFVPEGASECPECGHRLRGRRPWAAIGIAGLLAAGLVGIAYFALRTDVPDRRGADSSIYGENASDETIRLSRDEAESRETPPSMLMLDRSPPEGADSDPRGETVERGAAESVVGVPGPPLPVREAARSLVFLQTFDRRGRLHAQTSAALLRDRTAVLGAPAVLGAVSGRGWSLSGAFYRIGDSVAFDATTRLVAVRLEGAAPGPALRLRAAAPDPTEPVFVASPSPAGTSSFTVGRLVAMSPLEGDEPGWSFEGDAPAEGGWVLDSKGRAVGLLVPRADESGLEWVAAASVDSLLASPYVRSLELLNVEEYDGTARCHLDRALALVRERAWSGALDEFLGVARIDPELLASRDTPVGAAVLGAIEEARAGARYGETVGRIEEFLDRVPGLRAARVHAGRLFVEAGRYEAAVRSLLGALDAGEDSNRARFLLFEAFASWGDSLLRAGRARQAAGVFERGLVHTEGDASLLFGLGRARAALRDYDGARIAMEEALIRDGGLAEVVEPELEDVYRHLGGEGILTVDIPSDSRLIPVDVLISVGRGRDIETMYIDSGASWTFLTREFADRLGIVVTPDTRHAVFATANGEVTLPVVVLDEVNFRGFVVHDVEAAVGDLSSDSFRGGVLGNNFLKHFSITIDRPRGKMTFETAR
jgi:clan AA aspartic protease (TIGR02281 family)